MAKKGGKKKAKLQSTLEKSPGAARRKLTIALDAAVKEFTKVNDRRQKRGKKGQSQRATDLLLESLPGIAARMLAQSTKN
jgi:hypothetical protein